LLGKKTSIILALGFLSGALGLVAENISLFFLGITLIFFVAVNWIFYSVRERALFGKNILIEREIDRETAFIGNKFPVKVTVKNKSGRDFDFFKLTDHPPTSFDLIGSNTRVFKLKGKSVYTFSYLVIPKRRGVHRFPGFSVYESDSRKLFFNKKFFPVVNKMTIYPYVGESEIKQLNLSRRSSSRPLRIHKLRRKGLGSEFAGIREYVYGDSFRSIAWKAYAKTGKLMAREFESEIDIPIIIFLDISETMDAGRKGYTKLDYAIEAVVTFSKFALDNNDPVGIYTFTDTIKHHIPPMRGRTHLHSIIRLLAGIEPSLIVSGEEVYQLDRAISRNRVYLPYLKIVHDHLKEVYPDVFQGWYVENETQVIEYLENYFNTPLIGEEKKVVFDHLSMYISENDLKPPLLRIHSNKDLGLYNAVKQAIIKARESSLFIIISDLERIEASKKLKEALKLARIHHHNLIVLSPFSPLFEREATKEKDGQKSIETITEELLSLRFIESRRRFTREMIGMGIQVFSLGADDLTPKLLSHLVGIKHQKVMAV
jgi:uncharacterized protein (DUF58 family)